MLRTTMPKATIDEDRHADTWKNKVWIAKHLEFTTPANHSVPPEDLKHSKFGYSIPAASDK